MPTGFYKTMPEVDGRKRCVVDMMAAETLDVSVCSRKK